MEQFSKLPEDSISQIISFTSPVDASVFCVISKRFKKASESDAVWNKFLPSDIEDIVSRSSTPLVFRTKRDLYLTLSNSPILIDGGKLVCGNNHALYVNTCFRCCFAYFHSDLLLIILFQS